MGRPVRDAHTHPGPMLEDFQKSWNLEQQLEILALCGAYHTISFVANTSRLALEPFAEKFPRPNE